MKAEYPYTGKAIKPDVKVSGLDQSCYTVTYSNNTKAGKTIKTLKAGQGKMTYKLVSAKKGKKNFKKKFRINAKNDKLTVKKGLKKGTYKVTIKVRAAGNSCYNRSSWKKLTTRIVVK